MRDVKRADFETVYLLPPSVEDWLEKDHPARFIREFVQERALGALGMEEARSEEGGTYYDPKLLLMVFLYGYLKKIRSYRELERSCREDVAFIWLSGNHRPDHNAFWRFFGSYRKQIRALYKQTVHCAIKLDLVGLVLQAVDGTRIQAACSGWKSYNREQIEKLLKKIEENIEQQEKALEKAPSADAEPEAKLTPEYTDAKVLQKKLKAALLEIQQSDLKYCHPQELDARRMKTGDGNRFSYNAQAVVDDRSHIIVGQDLTQDGNDAAQLVPMIEEARANTQATPTTLADTGYANAEAFGRAQEAGLDVIAPLPPCSAREGDYHASKFAYDKERDVVVCPQNKELHFQRQRTRRGKAFRVYRSAKACRECPVRGHCTQDRGGRSIDITPFHHSVLDQRKKLGDTAVLQKLAKRSQIVEIVFAQIKAIFKFRRWSFKSLEKNKAQWSLLCSVWNLKVIYQRWKQKRSPPGTPCLNLFAHSF
jgi:transposase